MLHGELHLTVDLGHSAAVLQARFLPTLEPIGWWCGI